MGTHGKSIRHASRAGLVLFALGLLGAGLAGCSVQRYVLKTAFTSTADYDVPPGYEGTSFDKVADGVYSFRWGWYRNLAVVTSEGWVVTDPFNLEAAGLMHKALEGALPGRPVHTLIYSHYHVDHVRGGAALAPRNVLAHKACIDRWKDIGAEGVLPPTRLLEGEETLTVGGVDFQLLELGRSHGQGTLFAVLLPQKRVLWTADMGLVKTFPPVGPPDVYMPDMMTQLDRLTKLDFDVFVPSHFGYGKKQDLVDYLEFMRFLQASSRRVLARYGGKIPDDKDALGDAFAELYDPLKEKYGSWHGFDQQALFSLVRSLTGELMGY